MMTEGVPKPFSLRVRLGVALGIALAPVLLLGVIQGTLAFNREAEDRRAMLAAAAERSAVMANARLQSAQVLLETLSASSVGVECTSRLNQLMQTTGGFANLIRFDASGRVRCAADTVLGGRERREQPWFRKLAEGAPFVMDTAPTGLYAGRPAVLAAVGSKAGGVFDGAAVALIRLETLRPSLDRTMPADTQVAMLNRDGRFLTQTNAKAFTPPPSGFADKAVRLGSLLYYGDTPAGRRVFSAAPMLDRQVFVVLSAPAPNVISWARLNILTTVLLPILAFLLALAAVWVVAEGVILRWLHYLERIAAIYAKGRFSVRPVKAEAASPEIRRLSQSLSQMADAIAARDLSLHESLAQKDALMREIHHRVKNNLQVITSLLNMQQRAMLDEGAREAMSDTRQRIGALALIYRSLYQGPDLKRVDLRHFLEELIAQVTTSDPHRPAIRTELVADDLIIDPDKLAPLALFAVEAITNAQKHAFHDRGGLLCVHFRAEDQQGRLEFIDDGPGGEMGEGVGRTLMSAFARQLRGELTFEKGDEGGMAVILTFPLAGAIVPPKPKARPKAKVAEPAS